jgi:hypothetical protein
MVLSLLGYNSTLMMVALCRYIITRLHDVTSYKILRSQRRENLKSHKFKIACFRTGIRIHDLRDKKHD